MHATGTILRFLGIAAPVPMTILSNIGWWFMTTGQFLVLCSRLHLVVGKSYKLRWILLLIATVFLCFQLPTSVLFVISNVRTPNTTMIKQVFHVLEIMQLTAFTVQEGIMSGIYVCEFSRMLHQLQLIHGPKVMPFFRQLVTPFLLVVGLDISLLLTYCTGYFIVETTFLPVVYSIKLKVELVVLNTLISLLQFETCRCYAVSRHGRGRLGVRCDYDREGHGVSEDGLIGPHHARVSTG